MTLQGIARGGAIVLEGGVEIPDGTKVTVLVPAPARAEMSIEEEVARQKAALAELLALPDENPGDTFCAADYKQFLYGERQ